MSDIDRAADTTRRDFLKKAGVAAGATAWAVPTMQLVNMAAAGAQDTDPSPVTTTVPRNSFPSYVALNVTCDGRRFFIKWEDGGGWEDDPGATPACDGSITPYATKANGGVLGFVATPKTDWVEITVPAGCTVDDAVVKKGQTCCDGPIGGGTLVYFCLKT